MLLYGALCGKIQKNRYERAFKMEILSIGNSFSQDAQRYLHNIAKADGYDLKAFNLYIGGCSLYTHFKNMMSEQREYSLEMNGESTGFKVSLKEALLNREWDIITVQQVSRRSPYYETYQPYISNLVEYVRKYAPKAKIAVHQTWAYEDGSKLLCVDMGYKSHNEMFCDVKKAYEKASESICADIIIPSGELFCHLTDIGVKGLYRDTYHASLGLGRYAIGLVWYSMISGNSVKDNAFAEFEENVDVSTLNIVKSAAERVCAAYKIR